MSVSKQCESCMNIDKVLKIRQKFNNLDKAIKWQCKKSADFGVKKCLHDNYIIQNDMARK